VYTAPPRIFSGGCHHFQPVADILPFSTLFFENKGAVQNVMGPPLNLSTKEEAVAAIVNGGTDLEMGTPLFNSSMLSAVAKGLVTDATITVAARRNLMQRFVQGDFDPVLSNTGDAQSSDKTANKTVEWSNIPTSAINSTEHQQITYDASLQTMVLLKNAGHTLPLKKGATIAVVGPSSNTHQGLVAPYFGDFLCYMPYETKGNKTYDCVPTIGEKIAQANVGGTTTIVPGIDVDSTNSSGIAAAVAAAQAADVVVLAIGIDSTVEHEGRDVADITLPGLQYSFAKQILALNKPTVLVLTGDDATGIEQLVAGSSAIVRTFYSGMQGSKALASLLFGEANRWGKCSLHNAYQVHCPLAKHTLCSALPLTLALCVTQL
jgi:beta-glucosidase